MKDKIFANEIVNQGRQLELDMAKAILAFMLALIHIALACLPEESLVGGIPFLLDSVIGGAYGAPMLMLSMGACACYTRKISPQDLAKRGIMLWLLNYILNVCRYFIPYMIGYFCTGDYAYYIEPLPYLVFGNTIFLFAGQAHLIIAAFKKWNCPNIVMFLIAAILSVIATFTRAIDFKQPWLNIVMGYFIGAEDAEGLVCAEFPLFHWLIFPVVGYILGKNLLYVKEKGSFYGRLFLVLGLPSTAVMAYQIKHAIGIFGEGQMCFYHMTFADALLCCALNLGLLAVYYVLLKYLPQSVIKLIKRVSTNLTEVYFIHWVIVVVVTELVMRLVFHIELLSLIPTLLLGVVISIISILLACKWETFCKRRNRQ